MSDLIKADNLKDLTFRTIETHYGNKLQRVKDECNKTAKKRAFRVYIKFKKSDISIIQYLKDFCGFKVSKPKVLSKGALCAVISWNPDSKFLSEY